MCLCCEWNISKWNASEWPYLLSKTHRHTRKNAKGLDNILNKHFCNNFWHRNSFREWNLVTNWIGKLIKFFSAVVVDVDDSKHSMEIHDSFRAGFPLWSENFVLFLQFLWYIAKCSANKNQVHAFSNQQQQPQQPASYVWG